MTKKKKLGLDIDEVVLSFTERFLEFINKIRGTAFTLADVTLYDFEECGIVPTGTMEQYLEAFAAQKNMLNLPLMPGALESIEKLQEEYELYFITSRRPEAYSSTVYNLALYNLTKFPLYFSTRTFPKWKIAQLLGLDVFIDDNPKYIDSLADNHVNCLRVLMSEITSTWNCQCQLIMKKWPT